MPRAGERCACGAEMEIDDGRDDRFETRLAATFARWQDDHFCPKRIDMGVRSPGHWMLKDEGPLDTHTEHNKKYLNLNDEEYGRYRELMRTPMGDWPAELDRFYDMQLAGKSTCGDAISMVLANWVRIDREVKEAMKA